MPADTMTTDHQHLGAGLEGLGPGPPLHKGNGHANDDDAEDSLSSVSLSDKLAIWIEGEEHWISGVDGSTTCADLIGALLHYLRDPLSRHQEYAIVQKQRHYEEYLDGGARLCDVIANQHALPKEECQLQLRHLAPAPPSKLTPNTDKDSGMGSPVDSSRSMRFRRRGRHKMLPSAKLGVALEAEQWGETRSNPKQPKRCRKLQQRTGGQMTPNESLLTIILAQDETILHQMSMLHEKDRQILKIEEEKHRVRERELGKNYLLETYLKDLEEPQGIPEEGPLTPDLDERRRELHQNPEEAIALQEPEDWSTREEDDSVKDDPEMRIYWLEKIHAVNKELQREEELLLSLHAKVRRHQVKRAYQTKSEVLQQIERMDSELATQVSDIHRVERKLFTANEQLKAKLGVLECLGREFETTVSGEEKLDRLIQSAAQNADQGGLDLLQVPAATERPPVLAADLCNHNRIRRLDKNLNDRQLPDKGLSKQMFMGESPTSGKSPALRPHQLQTRAEAPDIEHLGTLV